MPLTGVNLPRGTGIVTRCPLQMEIHSAATPSAIIHYTTASGIAKDQKIDVKDVAAAVMAAQNDIAGSAGIVDSLIRLEVYNPGAPVRLESLSCKHDIKQAHLQQHPLCVQELTLIDLPGITRVALPGQPANIKHLIFDLIKKYMAGAVCVPACSLSC